MREPGDRIRLAAAGRVLNEIPPARTIRLDVGQQPAHYVELMKAGPDLCALLAFGLGIFFLDNLSIVFQYVSQASAVDEALPEIVGLEAIRVRRVARAVVPALIEWQEPRSLALEMRAEVHLLVIHRE